MISEDHGVMMLEIQLYITEEKEENILEIENCSIKL